MSNNATFQCQYVSKKFQGQQNQTGVTQLITVQWQDDDGNQQTGSVEMQPNDYAVMDDLGQWKVYNPIDFANLFTVTDNY